MKNILLESELKKIKLMMDYDPKETLTENEIPKLVTGDNNWEGQLDMTNAGAYAKFKNGGVFPQAKKWVYITAYSRAIGYGDITISQPKIETNIETDDPKDYPATVDFNASAEDPFEFDSPELTETAKKSLNELSDKILNVGVKYGEEFKTAYYAFLKNKTITINAYSSIDASSNFPDGGGFAGCSKYGIGKGPRKDYNKCLSQARAEKVVAYLKDKVGILSELTYEAIGRGETNKFSKLVWAEANELFPKNPSKTLDKKNPNGRDKTAPDRRFIVAIPKFTYETPAPNPIYNIDVSSNSTAPGDKPWCYKWAVVLGIVEPGDYKSKEGRNGMLVDDRNQPLIPQTNTQGVQSLISQKGVCWDTEAIGCDGTPGNYTWCKNQFPLMWSAGDDLGLGESIEIPCRQEKGGARLFFDENKIKESLGSDFANYFYFDTSDKTPTAKVTTNGITLTTKQQTIEFGPWKPFKNQESVDFLSTPYRYKISFVGTGGENDAIRIVGLQKFGFGLSTMAKI